MNKSLTMDEIAKEGIEVLKESLLSPDPDWVTDERTTDELIEEINNLKDKVNKRLGHRIYRDIGM